MFLFSLSAYIVSLACLGFSSVSQDFFDSIYLNSDTVSHSLFYDYIFSSNQSLKNWTLPHSFLIFPEFLIFLTVRAFQPGSLGLVNFVTSIVNYVLLQLVLFYFFNKIFYNNQLNIQKRLLALALSNVLLSTKPFVFLYYLSMAPHFHVGTVTTLFITWLTLLKVIKTTRRSLYLILFIMVFLFTLSDPLFGLYFTIPVAIASYLYKSTLPYKKLILVLCLSTLLSFISYNLLPFPKLGTETSLTGYYYSIFSKHVLIGWFELYTQIFTPLLLIGAIMVLGVWSFFHLYRASTNKQLVRLFGLFLILVFFSAMFLYISHRYGILLDLRVFYPVLIILFYFSIFAFATKLAGIKLWIVICIVAITSVVHIKTSTASFAEIGKTDTKLANCIEMYVGQENLKAGIGDFWLVYNVMALSSKNLLILPILPNTHGEKVFIAYGPKVDMERTKFDYFLTDFYMPKHKVISQLGEPNAAFQCSSTVWVLEYSDKKLRNQYIKNSY